MIILPTYGYKCYIPYELYFNYKNKEYQKTSYLKLRKINFEIYNSICVRNYERTIKWY